LQALGCGQVLLSRRLLQHHPDAGSPRGPGVLRILTEDRDLAPGPPAVPLEDLYSGGLPGTVGTEECEHLAPSDVQIYAADGLDGAVTHPQGRDVDHRLGGGGGAVALKERAKVGHECFRWCAAVAASGCAVAGILVAGHGRALGDSMPWWRVIGGPVMTPGC